MSSYKFYPVIRNGRFANHSEESARTFMAHSLLMAFQSWFSRQSLNISDLNVPYNPLTPLFNEVLITWIGHSSFLLHVDGFTILTDPVFYDISFLFKRIVPTGIPVALLPPIDIVLISHNHRDHMDTKSLLMIKKLNPLVKVLVAWGDKKWFDSHGFIDVQECMWWDKVSLTKNHKTIEFTFLPAFHWSQRGLFDHNKSLWGSWMIYSFPAFTIYFAGDTAYGKHFKAIAQEFNDIDIALMPIGPCEPHKWMQHSHINAQQAGQAFLELGALHFIPMHWGTFHFGIDSAFLPLERLKTWWQNSITQQIHQIHYMKVGQTNCILRKDIQYEEISAATFIDHQ